MVSYLRAGVQKVRQLCQLGVGAKHCLLTPEKSEILKGTFSLPLKYMKMKDCLLPPEIQIMKEILEDKANYLPSKQLVDITAHIYLTKFSSLTKCFVIN